MALWGKLLTRASGAGKTAGEILGHAHLPRDCQSGWRSSRSAGEECLKVAVKQGLPQSSAEPALACATFTFSKQATSSRQVGKAAGLVLARTTRSAGRVNGAYSLLGGQTLAAVARQSLASGPASGRAYSTWLALSLGRGAGHSKAGAQAWSAGRRGGRSGQAGLHSAAVSGGGELRHGWKALWEAWLEGSRGAAALPPVLRTVGAVSLACARSNVAARAFAVALGQATHSYRNKAYAEPLFPGIHINSRAAPAPSPLWAAIKTGLEGLVLVLRSVYLLVLFTPAVVMAPFADMFGPRFRKLWLRVVHASLEQAGAAFIKWGQWAATRPDLFPKDMCEQLTQLHSNAPAHSFKVTRKSVEAAFGRRISELFETFDETPVASGSIAQVHKAVLKKSGPVRIKGRSGGQAVAVKVRHPGVSEIIRRDFVIMNYCAQLCSTLPGLKWMRLDESVAQFAVFMLEQVDLAREAAQLSRFIYNFRRWKDVSFPVPVYPLVHPAVLVETFERGQSVAAFMDSSRKPEVNSQLAHLGTHTLLKMLLVDNFIHADLHPGNILVRMEKGSPTRPKQWREHPHLVLLDVGMTAQLSPKDRYTLLELFKGVALRDGRRVAEMTLQFSREQNCPDPRRFVADVEELFKSFHKDKRASLHTGECMAELLEEVRRHHVNIDGSVCTVIVTTLVLESWQRRLDPDLNIMDTLHALLFKADWATSVGHTIDALMAP